MRLKSDPQQFFHWSTGSRAKIVLEYEAKYNRISAILDENREILDLVDRDLRKLSTGTRRGRKATFTSENLLRALIVHHLEGSSLRETVIRLAHNAFLQSFVRLGTRSVMHFTLLDRAFKAIAPATWDKINAALTTYAQEQDRVSAEKLRVDTTVVESNIHWPTDSWLLWDSWRTLYRLLRHASDHRPGVIDHRFHVRKAKSLHLYITRYSTSPNKRRQRQVRRKQQKLLAQVERIWGVAEQFAEAARGMNDLVLEGIGAEIEFYLPKIRKVLTTAERAWIGGEVVPARDRIFSIFEDHTELIKRGRRHKPVEFGHMILLGQSPERFITQYEVMRKRVPDCQLPEGILDRHAETFGAYPHTLAADKGFRGDPDAMKKLREKLKVVAIPERLKDFADEPFVALQHFRAGIEGSISVLKRAFGLLRCRYRGFKSFVCNVGLGVFCHNLVNLARPPGRYAC